MTTWDRIYASEQYGQMIASKRLAVSAMTVFFIVYYFALPILVGYWPELMARPLVGNVNLAYLYAFSQFLMAWLVAFVYMRCADRYDTMSANILSSAGIDSGGADGDGD